MADDLHLLNDVPRAEWRVFTGRLRDGSWRCSFACHWPEEAQDEDPDRNRKWWPLMSAPGQYTTRYAARRAGQEILAILNAGVAVRAAAILMEGETLGWPDKDAQHIRAIEAAQILPNIYRLARRGYPASKIFESLPGKPSWLVLDDLSQSDLALVIARGHADHVTTQHGAQPPIGAVELAAA